MLELQNKAAQLAALLCTKRNIVRPAGASADTEPAPSTPATGSPPSAAQRLSRSLRSPSRSDSDAAAALAPCTSFAYDPRFLVFESISMMILREEQVKLVRSLDQTLYGASGLRVKG